MGIAIDKEEVRTLVKQYRRILKQSNASSISNLQPIVSESPSRNISPYMKYTEKYKELILKHAPYFHFITLTFHPKTGFKKKCQYTDFLCHLLNQALFSQKYKERGLYMEGFAFFEDHLSCHFDNPVHIHILIKRNDKFCKKDFAKHIGLFYKAAAKVRDACNRPVFNEDCIDIELAEDDGAINYCIKRIWDKNISRIKFIGQGGLSDNDDSFR